ncbi:MAG TPA: DUF4169 family protein [Bauldia sp.]|nr:DUF4169 family protein [Bauldia sp.]
MAEIINLRRARKAHRRTEAAGKAEANRAKFGRTRAEKEAETKRAEQMRRALDAHRRDDADER